MNSPFTSPLATFHAWFWLFQFGLLRGILVLSKTTKTLLLENPVHSSDTYQGFDAAIHTSGCQMKNTGLGKDRFPSLG